MKTSKEIRQEINDLYAKMKEAEKERKEINAGFDRANLKAMHEYLEVHKDRLHELDVSIKRMEIALAIMRNNEKLAIFTEVMPIALEVFNAYAGKPYGEKTMYKIAEAIKEKTGYRVFVYKEYSMQKFSIYGEQYYTKNVECSTKYNNGNQKQILIDNKIQEINFDDLEVWYIKREYIENVSETVDKLIELNAEAVKIQNQLKEVCSAFNALACDGIEHIYEYKTIYPLIK